MENLKQEIQRLYILYMKAKNRLGRDCLGLLKARITEWEKANENHEINNEGTYTLIASEIKKRNQFLEAIKDNMDLYKTKREQANQEIALLQSFLPEQIAAGDLRNMAEQFIIGALLPSSNVVNKNQIIGLTMGWFGKHHKNQYNSVELKKIVEEELNKQLA